MRSSLFGRFSDSPALAAHVRTRSFLIYCRPGAAAPERITRHATWLELFFDLVFVMTVNKVAGVLHADLSMNGLLHFGVLMVVVWWQWIDFAGVSAFSGWVGLRHQHAITATGSRI